MNTQPIPAILVLTDGSVFKGTSLGKTGLSVGEVVFNTSMTGYQEILTDPSYAQQMVTLTYPHIGNTGCNDEDCESDSVFATGLIIRDYPIRSSNFRSQQGLGEFLSERNIVAIADVDTRRLTRLLREQGAQAGCIMAGEDLDVAKAQQAAQNFPGLTGMDLAKVVSVDKSYQWTEGSWQLGQGHQKPAISSLPYHVVAYDYGIKRNILRLLVDQGCRVTVLPAQTPASDVLALKPDGIFLSNGPGDPEPCDYAIKAISELLETGIPMFGICLGHQLLALACGARTEKMKFGHHGANHPVQGLTDARVMITSQNHGFAVAEDSLPKQLRASHRSLFDGSLQGVAHTEKPAFSFQGHPEASPGPRDIQQLFAGFVEMIAAHKSKPKAVANNA